MVGKAGGVGGSSQSQSVQSLGDFVNANKSKRAGSVSFSGGTKSVTNQTAAKKSRFTKIKNFFSNLISAKKSNDAQKLETRASSQKISSKDKSRLKKMGLTPTTNQPKDDSAEVAQAKKDHASLKDISSRINLPGQEGSNMLTMLQFNVESRGANKPGYPKVTLGLLNATIESSGVDEKSLGLTDNDVEVLTEMRSRLTPPESRMI